MKRISRSLIDAVAALFPLAALPADAPNQKQPFTLTLEAPRRPLKAGETLILTVTVTDTLEQPVHVPISQGSYNVRKVYEVHVLDERGLPAPHAALPKPKGGGHLLRAGSIHGTQLKPGESLTDQVNVTHVYDLSQPGKYKIWIAEPFYRGPNVPNGLVRSNTITVTVND